MWVTDFSQPHQLNGNYAQSKNYQHFYPSNYAPGSITVNGRVPTQNDYNNLAAFIRGHHEELMKLPGQTSLETSSELPLITLFVANEGLIAQGMIQQFQGGAKRFNQAPPFTFDFFVVEDSQDIATKLVPSSVIRNTWSGNFIDEGNALVTGSIDSSTSSLQVSTAQALIDSLFNAGNPNPGNQTIQGFFNNNGPFGKP